MKLNKLHQGKKFPKEFNVFIETPQDSVVKYNIDEDLEFIRVDRILYSAMAFPFNYGFIPNTMSGDGDPMDVLVLSSRPVTPGSILESRAIGMLETEDERGLDNKILAVPLKNIDPYYQQVESIEDLDMATREKIRHFFEHYKELEPNKWVKVKNFHSKEVAIEEIKKSLKG